MPMTCVRRIRRGTGGAIVALFLAGFATMWYAVLDHGKPVVWSSTAAGVPHATSVVGGWLTPEMVVRPQADGLVAYDRTDGHRRWAYSPAGSLSEVCAVSPTAAGDGVVVFGMVDEHGVNDCGQIADIDTATGVVNWTAPLPTKWRETDEDPSDPAPAVAADVVVAEEPHGLVAFRRSDGTVAWTYSAPSPNCIMEAVSGAGDRLVAATRCPNGAGQVVSLDAHSGNVLWAATLPVTEGGSFDVPSYYTKVISADPPVVAIYAASAVDEWGQIRSYDGAGTLRAAFPSAGLELTELMGMQLPSSARVVDSSMIAVTSDQNDSPGSGLAISVVAYDIGSGRRIWSVDPYPGGSYELVGISGGDALVMEQNDSLLGPGHARLLRLSLSNGRSTVVEDYSPHTLADDGKALFIGDGSGLFAIDAQSDESPATSGGSTPAHVATHTAVVRIR